MSRFWWKVLLISSICMNAGFVSAFVVHKVFMGHGHSMPDLKLSPPVKDEFDRNYREFRARMDSLHAEVRTERAGIVRVIASDDSSAEAIKAQRERVLGSTDKVLDATVEHLLRQKSLLTAEQRAVFFGAIGRKIEGGERRSHHTFEEKQR